jgi:Asp-tRNA(Asn)/Glu-tRNA(Gln) amidotransferase A subunit family amidase
MGRHFGEADLFKMAHAYQQVTDWHKRRPNAK